MAKQILIAVFLTGGFLLAGCTHRHSQASSSDSAKHWVIGEYGSMTGSDASFGTSTDQGIRMAIDAINAKGGVKGKKIELISYDDQGTSDQAVAVVKRLITEDNVLAILGEVASNRSLAAAPIAQAAGVPMISPSSTNPKVTQVGNQIFRICFLDSFQGTAMAKFTFNYLKIKRVAVFRDMHSDYSIGLAQYYIKEFTKLGGKIVDEESYQAGDEDFKAQLTQIRANKPGAIFIPGYYSQVGLIARQARQLGIKATLLGGDGWDSPELYKLGGKAVNGAYYSDHFTPESKNPLVQAFVKEYKKRYHVTPNGLAAEGYDAAMILAQAMQRAPQMTHQDIRDAIAQTKDYQGVTGNITINKDRNAIKSLVVVKVDGPVDKFVTTVNPSKK